LKEGDHCLIFPVGVPDALGYPIRIHAYDAPGTVGMLAKRTKFHHRSLLRIPDNTSYSLRQWAAFSLRYITAWSNWKLAYGCWRLQVPESSGLPTFVCGWGGGTTFATLQLARQHGCDAAMIASSDERLREIAQHGLRPIDRREFAALDAAREVNANGELSVAYIQAERAFLKRIKAWTGDAGVSIFVEYIGSPVMRATLKALGREGVLTTAGWKSDMQTSHWRAVECISRHVHVHTHYANYHEALESVAYAVQNGWMPDEPDVEYGWDEIPGLWTDYARGRIESYFPIFRIN
jgi:NADPH:quinone reductase-like Zn-dependent oxidoreductase